MNERTIVITFFMVTMAVVTYNLIAIETAITIQDKTCTGYDYSTGKNLQKGYIKCCYYENHQETDNYCIIKRLGDYT